MKKTSFFIKNRGKQKKDAQKGVFFSSANLSGTSCGEAFAAVHGLSIRRIERNLAVLATLSANGGEHFSRASCTVLACITASLASLGLVVEALLSIELLLTGGEHEIIAAVLAIQCLVLVHVFYLSSK